ncbi:hypothetical protein PHIN8_17980 [Polynucleobacter sp. HIN8]|nr:hypothetical protein PHIN8_17980 [Polynucleobacter sp. HIN8]
MSVVLNDVQLLCFEMFQFDAVINSQDNRNQAFRPQFIRAGKSASKNIQQWVTVH